MQTEMIKATDLVVAINSAFSGVKTCHCQRGLLSADELLEQLVLKQIIPLTVMRDEIVKQLPTEWATTREVIGAGITAGARLRRHGLGLEDLPANTNPDVRRMIETILSAIDSPRGSDGNGAA